MLLSALSAALLLAGASPHLETEKYTLPSNGLEIILHEDHRLPVVAVNIWYHVGPINEAAGRTGFAHLFEHLMFQGSPHVGDDKHFKILEAIGASSINGTTGFDRTNYYETVPANQLETALWLESDRMGFLLGSLTKEKLDNQREVVKNERRQSVENRPYGPSREKFIQTLFQAGHPYHGNVIGSMDDLGAASLKDVREFFEAYYAPANATLVISGDFDSAVAKSLVAKYFADLASRRAPTVNKIETAPITEQRRAQVVEPVILPQLQIGWHSPPFFTNGDADADVLAYILGAGKSSRLHQQLVYTLEIAQRVSVSQQSNALASVFGVTVVGRPGTSLEELEAQTWQVLNELRAAPPTDKEVARARNMLVTGSMASLQRVGSVANRLNSYNHYVNDPNYLTKDLARYESITPQRLHTFANTLLDPNHAVVVITVPKSEADAATPVPGSAP